MATSRVRFRVAKVSGLGATPVWRAPEDASETFILGAVLVNNAGFVEEGGANPANIIGIADEAGHNAAAAGDSNMHFVPALDSIIFEGSVDNTAAGTGTIAATDMWTEYGITEDADGVWYIDKDKAAGATSRVRIVGFRDPVGEVMGRVYFKFNEDVTIFSV